MVVENVIEVTILRVKGKLLKSKMIAAIINEKGPLQIKSKEKHTKISFEFFFLAFFHDLKSPKVWIFLDLRSGNF